MQRDVGAVVPAAGQGRRLGRREAKAFVPVARLPLVAHTLRALQRAPSIRWIVVVAPPGGEAAMRGLCRCCRLDKVSSVVTGAATRSASVARGVAALPTQARWVLVHDGARPCVTSALVEACVRAARRAGAVACGLPASLTVKAVDAQQQVRLTLDRDQLWFVQTPQVFRRDWLTEALVRTGFLEGSPDDPTTRLGLPQAAHPPVNGRKTRVAGGLALQAADGWWDDAALLEWAGFPVRMVPGDPLNIKVTTKDDVLLAEAILTRDAKDHHSSLGLVARFVVRHSSDEPE